MMPCFYFDSALWTTPLHDALIVSPSIFTQNYWFIYYVKSGGKIYCYFNDGIHGNKSIIIYLTIFDLFYIPQGWFPVSTLPKFTPCIFLVKPNIWTCIFKYGDNVSTFCFYSKSPFLYHKVKPKCPKADFLLQIHRRSIKFVPDTKNTQWISFWTT